MCQVDQSRMGVSLEKMRVATMDSNRCQKRFREVGFCDRCTNTELPDKHVFVLSFVLQALRSTAFQFCRTSPETLSIESLSQLQRVPRPSRRASGHGRLRTPLSSTKPTDDLKDLQTQCWRNPSPSIVLRDRTTKVMHSISRFLA